MAQFYELPPPGFDPSRASREVLWRYGIPERPDPQKSRVRADFWDLMFPYPLNFAPPYFTLRARQVPVSGRALAISGGRHEYSLNWSGAYITPRDGKQFIEVSGHWHVPGASLPGGVSSTTECRSSVWIGLDGARRYYDSTLPQIGSGQEVNSTTGTPYYLWWQWWMRDNPPTYDVKELPVPVSPGDEIVAQLIVLNPTRVWFSIRNLTTNAGFQPFFEDAPILSGHQAEVSGATAEWIVERPADPVTGIFSLPDYTSATFTDAFAVQALPPAAPPGLTDTRDLEAARLVSMYQITGTPQRRVTLSRPRYPHIDRVQVDYVGP